MSSQQYDYEAESQMVWYVGDNPSTFHADRNCPYIRNREDWRLNTDRVGDLFDVEPCKRCSA